LKHSAIGYKSALLTFQGSAATYLRYNGKYHMGFVENLVQIFPKTFRSSIGAQYLQECILLQSIRNRKL